MALKMSAAKIKLAKVGGICAAAGLVIGIVGTLFFSNYNPPDKGVPENASVVFGRIVEQNTPQELFEHPKSERLKSFLAKVL